MPGARSTASMEQQGSPMKKQWYAIVCLMALLAVSCSNAESRKKKFYDEGNAAIDKKAYGDPSVGPKLNAILKAQPRAADRPSTKGCEVAHHPEDHHLRLAIRNGGKSLRDKLRGLL